MQRLIRDDHTCYRRAASNQSKQKVARAQTGDFCAYRLDVEEVINMKMSFGEWIALATLAVAVMQLAVMMG